MRVRRICESASQEPAYRTPREGARRGGAERVRRMCVSASQEPAYRTPRKRESARAEMCVVCVTGARLSYPFCTLSLSLYAALPPSLSLSLSLSRSDWGQQFPFACRCSAVACLDLTTLQNASPTYLCRTQHVGGSSQWTTNVVKLSPNSGSLIDAAVGASVASRWECCRSVCL